MEGALRASNASSVMAGRGEMDVAQFLLQAHAVQSRDREVYEQGNAMTKHVMGSGESLLLVAVTARDRSGIGNSPVRRHWSTRPDRTAFPGRAVADRDDQIHRRRFGAFEFVPAFAA